MLLLLVGMSEGNVSLVLTVVGIFTRLLGADVDIVGIRQTYVYCKETLPTQDARERYSKWENPEASRQGYENTLG